jgi:hypothetical protein
MQTGSACTGGEIGWGGYSHQAGDRFIFKGGVTWPAACFGMNVSQGGSSSGVMDYYGVDVTWFVGGTRPIFDLANTIPTSTGSLGGNNVIWVTGGFITFDNIEIKRQFIKGGHSGPNSGYDCGIYFFAGSSGNIVKNSYFHDWVSDAANINAGFSNCAGGLGQNGGGYTADNVIIEDSIASPVEFGGCFQNALEVKNSLCHHVSQGVLGFGSVHDSEFFAISNKATVSPYTNGIHSNVIHQTFPGGGGSTYNLLIHDNPTVGENLFICDNTSAYNNVIWNTHIPAIDVDTGGGNCPTPTTATSNIYNNTVVCPAGGCLRILDRGVGALNTLNAKNNHWISDSSTPACWNNPAQNCVVVTTVNNVGNLTMSPSTAESQGYTISNKFMPTSTSSKTVNAASSLSVLCSGNLGSLCADRLHISRLTSWDAGAYEFTSQSATPNPPSNLNAIVQ